MRVAVKSAGEPSGDLQISRVDKKLNLKYLGQNGESRPVRMNSSKPALVAGFIF
jgi:hypothetical protein